MSDTYKICFLGYKKLGELAHQVIEHLNYSDTTIILKECSIETLVQAVNEAISEGLCGRLRQCRGVQAAVL